MLGPTQYAIVDGHQLAYHRAGSGEPVVLVHGITTYSFIWQEVAPLLEASGYDVIVLDLLGCGESDMPLDVSYAIKDHAVRLHGLVSVLGIEKFHLVGHDLGGGVAQILAVRFPEMLYDLALLNSVGYDMWPVQPITAVRTPVVRQLMMAALDMGAFRLIVRRAVHNKELVTDDLMAQFHMPLSSSTGRRAFMHFARCLDNQNLTEIAADLSHLDVPTLIIRGDEDPYLSAEIAEKLHTGIPGSTLLHIPEASHFVQLDAPETTAAALLDHFRASRR
jgi:pimeloyl-ACP methyl ester carboxylesterase